MLNMNKIYAMLSLVPDDFAFKGLTVDNNVKMILHFDYTEKAFDEMVYKKEMEQLQRLLNDIKGEQSS